MAARSGPQIQNMKHFWLGISAVLCVGLAGALAQAQSPIKRAVPAAQKMLQKKVSSHAKEPVSRMLERKAWQARNEKLKQTVSPTAPDKLKAAVYNLSPVQMRAARLQYYRNMREYAALKKHIETRLFYQQYKNDKISAVELADVNFHLSRLEEKLAWSAMVFQDAPLSVARRQLIDLRAALDPFAAPGNISLPKALRRNDRKFDKQEFYLYGQDGSSPLVREYSWLLPFVNRRRAREAADQLPHHLQVVVLNDSRAVLTSMTQWQKEGVWGKNLQVRVFQRQEDFWAFLRAGGQVDMLITDLIMPKGGGFFLASELRQQGYKMPILALSAFGESEKRGQKLFTLGFDGMLSTHAVDGALFGTSGYLTFVNALRNYYTWKKLKGWDR